MANEHFRLLIVLVCYNFNIALGLELKCDLHWNKECIVRDIQIWKSDPLPLTFDVGDGSAENVTNLELYVDYQDYNSYMAGLTSIPIEVFTFFPHLVEFRIESNLIEIPSNAWVNASNLKQLRISKTKLAELAPNAFNGLTNLKYLYVTETLFTSIQRQIFVGLNQLEELSLSESHIQSIDDDAFDLPELKILFIQNGKLTSLSDTVFSKLPKLESIYLSRNKLTHIGRSLYLPQIQIVYLSNNQIIDIDLVEFAELSHIKELYLAESGFSFDSQNSLKQIGVRNTSLKKLDLSQNNLKNALDLQQLRIFAGLESLDLYRNPFWHFYLGPNINTISDLLPKLKNLQLAGHDMSCNTLRNRETKQELRRNWNC